MINVLPENEKFLLKKEYRIRLVTVILFAFAVLLISGSFLLTPFYILSSNKINALEIQLNQYNKSTTNSSGDNLTKVIDEINQNLQLLNKTTTTQNISEEIIAPMLSVRPLGIKFSRIFYSTAQDGKKSLDINGLASDRTALRTFEEALKKNPHVESTKLPVSNFTKRTDIDFSISIVLK